MPNVGAPLIDRWKTAIEAVVGGEPRISLLYSGGLDSSVIAHSLRSKRPTLVTVGADGAPDVPAATEGARLLELPLIVRTITVEDVRAAVGRWGRVLEGTSEMAQSIALGITLAAEAAPDRRVLCGQGADELFLGYAHFNGIPTADAELRAKVDWTRLIERDWPLARNLASTLDKELASPYLEPDFATYVGTIPVAQRLGQGARKAVLRELARDLGVPAILVDRPKKALQWGSGLSRLLRRTRHDPGHRATIGPTRV